MLRNVVSAFILALMLGTATIATANNVDDSEAATPISAEQGFSIQEEARATNVLTDHDDDADEEEKISSDAHIFNLEDDNDDDDFE